MMKSRWWRSKVISSLPRNTKREKETKKKTKNYINLRHEPNNPSSTYHQLLQIIEARKRKTRNLICFHRSQAALHTQIKCAVRNCHSSLLFSFLFRAFVDHSKKLHFNHFSSLSWCGGFGKIEISQEVICR